MVNPEPTERDTSEGSCSLGTYTDNPLSDPMKLLLNPNVGLQQITEEDSFQDIPGSGESQVHILDEILMAEQQFNN